MTTRKMPTREVLEHGVGGVVQQVAAIEKGNDLHAGWKDVVVQFGHLLVDAFEHGVGVLALLQQDDALDDIAVVDQLAILFCDDGGLAVLVNLFDAAIGAVGGVGLGGRRCAEAAGLADLAQADLRPLDDGRRCL